MIPANLQELSELDVARMLRPLTRYEAKVIKLRFGIGTDPHNLDEVASMMGCTRETIRQTELKAMETLGWVSFQL